MRPITVQTGSSKGTYKLGDQHPFISDRVFMGYAKHPKGGYREKWATKAALARFKEKASHYYAVNKTERLSYSREYRKLNPNKVKEACHNWYNKNKAKVNAASKAREAGLLKDYKALPENSKAVVRGIYEASQRVSECLGVPFHVDHIVPISKGGTHSPENLQIVPAKWNLQKGNRHSGGFEKNF